MKTKEQKIARIAALFAVSNLGQFHMIKVEQWIVDDQPAPRMRSQWTGNAYSDVCMIAGHLMENDEHEHYFGDEATGWVKELSQIGDIKLIAERWPHHSEWLLKIDAMPEV